MNLTETYRSRLSELFPFWSALSSGQQERLKNALQVKCVGKNELVAIESPLTAFHPILFGTESRT